MKHIIFTLASLLLLGLPLTETHAQFKLSAELRPRAEYSHGYKTLASSDQKGALFTTQRTRLNLDYKNDVFATKMVLQDVRLWGNQAQLVTNEDYATSIHEAWAEWFMTENWSLKAGRQEVSYDDQRIFGSVGWAQQARSHDMAIVKYKGTINLHIGLAYNNSNSNNNFYEGPDAYKSLQYIWLNRQSDSYSGSFLFLNNGIPYWKDNNETEQGTNYSQTMGGHLSTTIEGVSLAGNLYGQFGKDGNGNSLSAFNFSIDALFGINEKADVGAGYELLSGTGYDDDSGKNKSFSPFYGTNHKFNGFMDYFYVGNHMNNVGLHDLYLKGNITPGKVKFNGALHFFNAHKSINADVTKYLGTELDLWCGYNHKGAVSLDFGYSHLFASEGMEALKGGDKNASQNWAWLMLTFKPTFFEN